MVIYYFRSMPTASTYDRVHVNGSACGHLKQKLITHSFMVRNAWVICH